MMKKSKAKSNAIYKDKEVLGLLKEITTSEHALATAEAERDSARKGRSLPSARSTSSSFLLDTARRNAKIKAKKEIKAMQRKQQQKSARRLTGRNAVENLKLQSIPSARSRNNSVDPVRRGAAGLLDQSWMQKGIPALEKPVTSYKQDFNGDRPQMAKELKQIYKMNSQYWLPRNEQTIINEYMSLQRKLKLQAEGKG